MFHYYLFIPFRFRWSSLCLMTRCWLVNDGQNICMATKCKNCCIMSLDASGINVHCKKYKTKKPQGGAHKAFVLVVPSKLAVLSVLLSVPFSIV